MKKSLSILFIIISILAVNIVFAAEPAPANVTVHVNGNKITFDQEPVIVSGRTLVPLRAIFESLGASLNWNEQTKTITATKGADKIILKVGNLVATVNNKQTQLEVEPIVVNGRTLVPARFIAESFGMVVGWDASTRKISIDAKAAQLNAEGLLQAGCITCHGINTIYQQRSKTEWPEIINRMVGRSSYPWKPEEVKTISDFLINTYGK
ncbi:hypothetical protein BHU72_00875 [Desulfuribacillus stibiiarsenatis]|uniref:Copper amine oxidase-like N-terminal domain-containing protein n=1 Tax=Desulfuribacillus stibiiarsenatis TaxID=1390249 RepID=A0A1E5L9P4_9FIRM|nr:copper amine oxidase N-terminal domain-containing protein [Desulfuribacillus stibiiarsenatis]OEH86851.1 hypothetical protein BHU72_00875 [Desulfuribacillus stibiiarsenatis]